MDSIQEFIDYANLKINTLPTHSNPNFSHNLSLLTDEEQVNFQKNLNHWSCKISKDNKDVVVFISMSQNRRWWKIPPNSPELWASVPRYKVGTRYDGPWPVFNSYEEQRIYEECSEPESPTLIDVLHRIVVEKQEERLKDILTNDEYKIFLETVLK